MSIAYKGIETRSASLDRQGVRRATDVHIFVADDDFATPYDIGNDPNCPRVGSTYSSDPGSWCESISIEMHEPKRGYRVTASYSSEREIAENPLDEPAYYTIGNERYQEPLIKDLNGKAVVNSAGDMFDPPLLKNRKYPQLTVHKNIDGTTLPSWLLQYEDAINSDEFTVAGFVVAIGYAQVARVRLGLPKTRNDVKYYAVEIDIHMSERGWKKIGIDAGFRMINDTGKRQRITMTNDDGTLEYPPAPVPLDGTGKPIEDPNPDNIVLLEFDADISLPFADLPLV